MGEKVDVLLLLEGTYPYIRGGVSTWIYQLITGLPDLRFGAVFLGSRPEDYNGVKYELPKNLLYLETHYLFDRLTNPPPKPLKGEKKAFDYIKELHNWFRLGGNEFPEEIKKIDFYLNYVDYEQFLYSIDSWQYIISRYEEFAPDLPFIDYFWTVRNIHTSLWVVAKIASKLKNFEIIHSPSTGYAGFLGGILKFHTGRPFIITEHGIYTRERKLEIINADWLIDRRLLLQREQGEIEYIRKMWIRFFESIGRYCYDASDIIISLFDRARQIQIGYGADPKKTRVIPNGVDLKKLRTLRGKRTNEVPRVVGLLARVVPIKDIKTFIKAMKMVVTTIPEAQGWIIGPEDEDPDYAEECRTLVKWLGLENNVKFLGFRAIEEVLPRIGVATLTSISEGMPLVVLEAFGAGIPVVTTDVGSCRQLIYGYEEDLNLGKAGEVVPIANPSALANAYIKLLTDKEEWESAQKSAIDRVEKYYSMENFLGNYRRVYEEALSWQV